MLTNRCAGKDERESTSKMAEEDETNGGPNNKAVQFLVSALKQAQVTNEKSNLEETDSKLVDGSSSEVHPGICDFAEFGSILNRKS